MDTDDTQPSLTLDWQLPAPDTDVSPLAPATDTEAALNGRGGDWDTQMWRKRTHQRAFLAAYTQCGNSSASCRAVGITLSAVYLWQQEAEFVEAFRRAKDAFGDALEALALERVQSPEGNRGSDILLIFLLKAAKPDKYRELAVPIDDTAKQVLGEWRKYARQLRESVTVTHTVTESVIPVTDSGYQIQPDSEVSS